MSFHTLLGQDEAKAFVRAALEADRVGHAYLFVGPDGVGKTRLALDLCKALLCRGGQERPCNTCRDCRMAEHGRHPDLLLVQAQENRRQISIDQIRELIGFLSLRPMQSARRTAIVREADRMNDEASNCFLKTLEEPPGSALLVLTTSRPEVLLPTVRSRCQEVRFGPLSPEQVCDILGSRPEFGEEEARLAAHLSAGSAGRALRLLESGSLERYRGLLEGVLSLPERSYLALADEVLSGAAAGPGKREAEREELRVMLGLLSCAYRDMLLLRIGAQDRVPLYHQPVPQRMAGLARRLSVGRLMAIQEALLEARRQVDANAAVGLVMDNLFAHLADLQAAP